MENNLIKKHIGKEEKNVSIDRNIMDRKKALRIPIAPSSQIFKDKSKYNRRQKYKKKYEENM